MLKGLKAVYRTENISNTILTRYGMMFAVYLHRVGAVANHTMGAAPEATEHRPWRQGEEGQSVRMESPCSQEARKRDENSSEHGGRRQERDRPFPLRAEPLYPAQCSLRAALHIFVHQRPFFPRRSLPAPLRRLRLSGWQDWAMARHPACLRQGAGFAVRCGRVWDGPGRVCIRLCRAGGLADPG